MCRVGNLLTKMPEDVPVSPNSEEDVLQQLSELVALEDQDDPDFRTVVKVGADQALIGMTRKGVIEHSNRVIKFTPATVA